VPSRWDHATFLQANHFLVTPEDRTLFDGILQVPPGHFLIASGGNIQLIRYWDFDYPAANQSLPAGIDQEYAEQFRHVLDQAVQLRLRADVSVGCYLSGGIDSCAVLGLAAMHRSDPIQAFALTFDRSDYDEGDNAREMATHVGADFHPISILQSDLADNFGDATWQAETICFNAHGVAKYLLSRAVRAAGYKVVLTGEGADEILAGYPPFRRDMLSYNRQGQDADAVSQLVAELQASNPFSRGLLLPEGQAISLASVRSTLGFVPSWLEASVTATFRLHALFAPDFATELADGDPYRVFLNRLDLAGQLANREPYHPVAPSLVQVGASQLRLGRAWRSDGDGTFCREPPAVSGPQGC
jgi:asparagine synthase (glutamine-hydrolysing)